MDYFFGFSLKGIVVFILTMIPNIFYFMYPNTSGETSKHLILGIVEHGCQVIFILLLVFLVGKQDSPLLSSYTICMAVLLLAYYVLWIFFFKGDKTLLLLLGMAVLPVVYFILAEIWLHNFPAIFPTGIFGFVHVLITYRDYSMH